MKDEVVKTTVSFPQEMYTEIISLRKNNKFIRCSYSEIVRQLIRLGLNELRQKRNDSND